MIAAPWMIKINSSKLRNYKMSKVAVFQKPMKSNQMKKLKSVVHNLRLSNNIRFRAMSK